MKQFLIMGTLLFSGYIYPATGTTVQVYSKKVVINAKACRSTTTCSVDSNGVRSCSVSVSCDW